VRVRLRWSGNDLGGDIVIARRAPAADIGRSPLQPVVGRRRCRHGDQPCDRGEDHIANTPSSCLLYEGWAAPAACLATTP